MNFADFISTKIIPLLSSMIAFVIVLIFAVFIWRIVSAWIVGGGDEDKVKSGKQTLIVGLIVLVSVFAMWGIVSVLQTTFGLG